MNDLANIINESLLNISDHLPRLQPDHSAFHVTEPVPANFCVTVEETEQALRRVKSGKAMGPDNIPAWVVKGFAPFLVPPVAAIFNSLIREGVVPTAWKSALVIPLPKTHPPKSIETDLRPISLTPILSKVLEHIVWGLTTRFCRLSIGTSLVH